MRNLQHQLLPDRRRQLLEIEHRRDERAVAIAGARSWRDVIAFPKTTAARALFEGAPTPVKAGDLQALHLTITD